MKPIKWILAALVAAAFVPTPNIFAQLADATPATPDTQASKGFTAETQELNIEAYIDLLRADVRAKKTAILTETMQFNDQQAAKFWPVYHEYDAELQKLNDQRVAGIKEYAKNYANMTDAKADELAKLALDLENRRNELKKKYYEKIRDQIGAIMAARFLQVENQMLMVIDLQISSSLPIMQ